MKILDYSNKMDERGIMIDIFDFFKVFSDISLRKL